MTPNAGIVGYEPAVPFWSDHAIKSRWFSVPDLSDTIDFSEDGNWTFPEGMVWVKHFDLEMTRGNPATRKKIETRFLVNSPDGYYGVSYRWNEDETEATLVSESGEDRDFTINDGGNLITQTWRYPSYAECISCHTQVGGSALSFNTRQLNRTHTFVSDPQNQIEALRDAGYLSPSTAPEVGNAQTLPKVVALDDTNSSMDFRIKSYLHINCAQCHQPNGPAPSAFDARITTPLSEAGLIETIPNDNGGNPDARIIDPGAVINSVLLSRVSGSNGHTRMPPIGSNELDQDAIDALTDWINNHLNGYQSKDEWKIANFGSTSAPEAADDANSDGDELDNEIERLIGTDPNDSSDQFDYTFGLSGDASSATFTFDRPANVRLQIEASTDLADWHSWDSADNSWQLPASTVLDDSISGATDGATEMFFRFIFSEP